MASSLTQLFIRRPALGLPEIYHCLPHDLVMCSPTVSEFQSKLQEMVKTAANRGIDDWKRLLSPRSELLPLLELLQ